MGTKLILLDSLLQEIEMLEEKNVEFCKQCQLKGLKSKILKFATIQNKNTSLFFCSSRKCPVHFFRITSKVLEKKNQSQELSDSVNFNEKRKKKWGRLWLAKEK